MTGSNSNLASLLSLFDFFAPPPRSCQAVLPGPTQLVNLGEAAAAALALRLYLHPANCRAARSPRSGPVILRLQKEKNYERHL